MKSLISTIAQTIFILLAISFIAFLIPTPLACGLVLIFILFALLLRWLIFKKNRGTIFLTVFSIIALLFFALCLESNPYTFSSSISRSGNEEMRFPNESLTKKQALKDLDFAMHRIKKIHPAAHGGLPKKLATEWKKVREEIEFKDEDASISKIELAQKIESIFSLLNDAHTNITFSFVDARYLKHAYTHIQAKDELISVNGKSKRDIFLENRNLFSTENDEYAISRIGNYITSLEGLAYLNIEPEDGAFNYEFQHIDGSTETFAYPISDFVSYDEYLSLNYAGNNEEENEEAPKQQSFVHYETDVKNSIATLTLDTCTFNDVYKETLRSFFDEVKTNKIRNLIVDLRNNGGGNSLVANEFMRYLAVNQYKEASSDLRMGPFTSHSAPDVIQNDKYEGYNFDGQIYVLTSVQTFSSAMMFAMYIKDNNLGQVVGEASGNNPSSYGDVVCFRLPESRLYMQVSWKKWYRIDESKDGELIEPDIPVKADDALSSVIELIVGPTIPEPEFVDYLGLDYQNPDELNAENLEGTEPATN